jgi:lipid-binding SYLF domain-containing protein
MLNVPEGHQGRIGIGGECGEGALLIGNKTVGYYNIVSGSIVFNSVGSAETRIIHDQRELDKFRKSDGWKAGADGSVALATLGAGGQVDTETAKKPIIGFIYSNKGLMYNLTFEGSKISEINK